MDELKTPYIDKGLLDYLQRLYPDVAPEPDLDERRIWINRGAVGVVRHLLMLHKDQQDNMLGELEDVLRK
jgi:hypothetical protein